MFTPIFCLKAVYVETNIRKQRCKMSFYMSKLMAPIALAHGPFTVAGVFMGTLGPKYVPFGHMDPSAKATQTFQYPSVEESTLKDVGSRICFKVYSLVNGFWKAWVHRSHMDPYPKAQKSPAAL